MKNNEFNTEEYAVVVNTIHETGVTSNLKGYRYLVEAVRLQLSDPATYLYGGITKTLYPAIAKKFCTTHTRVERAIRHAVETAYDRGDPVVWSKYFGYSLSRKPTNKEFIATISERISMKLMTLYSTR